MISADQKDIEKLLKENERLRSVLEKTPLEPETTQDLIINYMMKKRRKVTSKELAAFMHITERGIRWNLQKLRDQGLIIASGSNTLRKYRLVKRRGN